MVGLNLTYRKLRATSSTPTRLVFDGRSRTRPPTSTRPAVRPPPADYVRCGTPSYAACPNGTLPNGQPYTANVCFLRNGLSSRGGYYLYNSDEEQEYKGASLVFNKRLANRWMFRGNFTYSDWTWSKVPSSDIIDPTRFWAAATRRRAVLQGSGTGSGSKAGVYINSKWSYSVNGLYQIAPDHPWGFNVALNLTGRQGYPIPVLRRGSALPANENIALRPRAGDQPAGQLPARQHPHRRRSPGEGVQLQRLRLDARRRLLQHLQRGLRPAAPAPAEGRPERQQPALPALELRERGHQPADLPPRRPVQLPLTVSERGEKRRGSIPPALFGRRP